MTDTSRKLTMADLGPAIPEVSFDFFKKHILPPLHPSISIPQVLASLKSAGVINSDQRWQMFAHDPASFADSTKSSTDMKKTENEVFGRISELIQALKTHSCGTNTDMPSSLIEYESKHSHVPIGREEVSLKPDGYFLFKTHTGHSSDRRYWRDLFIPAEYKLQDRKVDLRDVSHIDYVDFVFCLASLSEQDVSKICGNMFRMMLEDPRRRFVNAFTIENTTMRVWTANRSGIIVSTPFNFVLVCL
jgi:hypothetical protein